jgi:hypothetical protein
VKPAFIFSIDILKEFLVAKKNSVLGESAYVSQFFRSLRTPPSDHD